MSQSRSSQTQNTGNEFKTVRGYAIEVPSNKGNGSDEEDEEDDDEDDNWLDYSQMKNAFSQGTFIKQYKKPRHCQVNLRDLDHPQENHSCCGRFVLLDPWWEMTVSIAPNKRVHGLIQFAVRQDLDGVKNQNLVPFLINTTLQRCLDRKKAEEIMNKFDDFVRIRGKEKTLTFEDLDPEVNQFTQTYPEYAAIISKARMHGTIQAVLRGQRYPALLHFLCRLFPLTFLSCLLSPMEKTLAALDKAAQVEPWVFGFRAIMGAQFRVYGVEASYKAFEIAGVMSTIPPAQKDALYIYEVLKKDATHGGHTYISFADLRQHRHWAQLSHVVSDWAPALTFLAHNRVTTEERFGSCRNFFLYHNWKAEVEVADGLKEVLCRGIEAKKPIWEVDFTSPDLTRLRGDDDQWAAAQKVAGSPICVMSGKGGCGKTTVVTQVIQHVCRQTVLEDPVPEHKDDIDDTLANAELYEISGSRVNGEKPGTSQPRVTQQQVSQMIEMVTQSLEENQAQDRSSSPHKRKRNGMRVDLSRDLIKYLGVTGDTALSKTSMGRKILLTAPTGKAAKLLGHKAKMESFTLHRIIYSYRAFIKAQQKKLEESRKSGGYDSEAKDSVTSNQAGRWTQKDPHQAASVNPHSGDHSEESTPEGTWKHAGTEVLVVDECSLVSLRIFATLLNILIENTPLWKVVLLGDIRQLPSIEPGNFLGDVFTTFRERGLSIELRTNHRSESELIVGNASRISQRLLPVVDPARHFHHLAMEDASADPERDATIRDLLQQRPELQSHETSQFVAFRRADCDAINELCCKHYNHHSTRDTRANRHPYDFRIGDKICFRKNGQVLNHGKRLRGYLNSCPGILEAFGISEANEKKSNKKDGNMNVTAALEQVLSRDQDHETELQPQWAGDRWNRKDTSRSPNSLPAHWDPVSQTSEVDESGRSVSQPSGVPVRQERVCGDGHQTARVWNGTNPLPASASIAVQREKEEGGDQSSGGSCAASQPWQGKIKQEKPWGDENMDSHLGQTRVKRENLWGDEHVAAHSLGMPGSSSYDVPTTDFGIKMEHLSRVGAAANVPMPSASAATTVSQHPQLSLFDTGADDTVIGNPDLTQGCSLPNSSQDTDDEEEWAGKLKNGSLRLCNGEVFFIMDDVRESEREGSKESRFLTLSDRDPDCPRVVCASYAALKRECRLRHSWARTIHTYQGSESDTVVYYVGESKLQNWKHVYTAVTRGRKSVFIVGKESELRRAVWQKDIPRRSRLSRRLTDMMRDLQFQELHAMMRQTNERARAALLLPTTPPSACLPSADTSFHAPGGAADISTPSPPADCQVKSWLIDPFPDSDDSWVRDMSPVWADDYALSKDPDHAAASSYGSMSPDLFLSDSWEPWPATDGETGKGNDRLEAEALTPSKRPYSLEQVPSTPKRSRATDPVDRIVSPLKRTLNI